AFHSRYFPPGCVAEGVSLRQGSQQGPPLIVVPKLSIRSTLAGLISGRRVSIRADGMRVLVPATGSREPIKLSSHSNIRIIEFAAENAVLEIGRSDKQPLRFLVHELKLRNMGTGSRLLFNVRLTNPEPPGEISASGEFGPWNARDFGRTPLVGEYLFQGADLGVFRGIRGQLSSHGRIQDLLRLFIKSPRAPMYGVVSFRATTTIPPGKTPFLKKVTLTGDFGIDEGNFKPRTQEKVNKLSAGAQGEKGEEKDGADLQ